MQHYTHFENLIFEFCQRNGVGLIQPDQNLNYVLYVDQIEVRCYSSASRIYLRADLGELPKSPEDQRECCKYLMQQMLLDSGCSPCVVSLNDRGRLTVHQQLTLDQCGPSDFEEGIEELANQVEVYSGILAGVTGFVSASLL